MYISKEKFCQITTILVICALVAIIFIMSGFHCNLKVLKQDKIGNQGIEEEISCPDIHRDGENCQTDRYLNGLDQEDEELIRIIKRCFVFSIPKNNTAAPKYNLSEMSGQNGQPVVLDNLYGNKTQGFYVEVGARDGLFATNTLLFEQERNWTGLLIEAGKDRFNDLKKLGRKAHIVNACVGTTKTPSVALFDGEGIPQNERVLPRDLWYQREPVKPLVEVEGLSCVQCLPLYSILKAVGNPTIDLFFLDIEGAEYPVLQQLPFGKVNIQTIIIEWKHLGTVFKGDKEDMIELMTRSGYSKVHAFLDNGQVEKDVVFAKNGLEGINMSALERFARRETQNAEIAWNLNR